MDQSSYRLHQNGNCVSPSLDTAGNKSRGGMLRKLLENYGFEVVMQYNEAHRRKRPKSTSDLSELPDRDIELNDSNAKHTNSDSRSDDGRLDVKKLKLDDLVNQMTPDLIEAG